MRTWRLGVAVLGCCLSIGLIGCETLQKKFTRKPKPRSRASPIIGFQDYTRAMTPLDRYRKHYVLFEYWNDELINALGDNAKRARLASQESLNELKTLRQILEEPLAQQLDPLIRARERIDQPIQGGTYHPGQVELMKRDLDAQTRALSRTFFWRKVEDRLRADRSDDAPND